MPRRLVLALDGVDYRDLQAARARGLFQAFHSPGRLVSTFPSISDIAWHAILGVQPPAGYQRVYYSLRQNAVVGDALDALRPIEYEERMDAAFDTKFHHFGAYVMSGPTARHEVDDDARTVLRTHGRETVYVYNVGPDALQHTRGNMTEYLEHLDRQLTLLLETYQRRTGRPLEILVLSDHGHNHAADATFLPVTEALKARGFVTAKSLRAPNDVVFSVDGVTTGFGVFCAPDSVERVARILAGLDGVDVVSRQLTPEHFEVQSSAGLAAVLVRGRGDSTGYAYVPSLGDPLGYDTIMVRMRRDGVLPADGYVDAATWLRYTATARYPAAIPRIVHGHLNATRNPAPILVSLDDRYRVGLGMMSVTDRIFGLGGTHGALTATNSLGIVMSNVRDTPDVLATEVYKAYGGFTDLLEPKAPQSTLRISTAMLLRSDRLTNGRWRGLPLAADDSAPLLVLRISDRLRPLPTDSLWFEVTVRRRKDDRLIATTALPATHWWAGRDGREWAVPARDVRLDDLEPGTTYELQVRADARQPRADGSFHNWSARLVTVEVRAARDRLPWTF